MEEEEQDPCGRGKERINTGDSRLKYILPPFPFYAAGPGGIKNVNNKLTKNKRKSQLKKTKHNERSVTPWPSSPLPDDLLGVTGHMVVADDVVQAGQSLLHVLLQPLQVLRLLVHGDDGVLQLHQAALKGRQDGHLGGTRALRLPGTTRSLALAAFSLVFWTMSSTREGPGVQLFTPVSSAHRRCPNTLDEI